MNILPAPKGMPTILTRPLRQVRPRRARWLRPRRPARGPSWKKAATNDEPGRSDTADRRRRPARPRRCRLSRPRTSGAPRPRQTPTSATSWPTASRPTRAPRSIARSWRTTRTPSSRVSPWPRTRLAPPCATSPSARTRPPRCDACNAALRAAAEEAGLHRHGRAWRRLRHSRRGRRDCPAAWSSARRPTLLRAIENKRAQPDQRPPYPSRKGLWGRPTVVNNVETLALVPWIVANGSAAFAEVGDDRLPRHDARSRSPARSTSRASPRSRWACRCGGCSTSRAELAAARRSSRPCSSVARPAVSCRRRSSTRSTRPMRSPKRARSGAQARSSSSTSPRASSTWPRLLSATCPTSRAARPSRAASACAGCTRLASAPRCGLSKPTDAADLAEALAADVRDARAVRPGVLRAQSVPDRNAILRRRVRGSISRSGTCPAGVCSPVQVVAQPVSA